MASHQIKHLANQEDRKQERLCNSTSYLEMSQSPSDPCTWVNLGKVTFLSTQENVPSEGDYIFLQGPLSGGCPGLHFLREF